MIATCASFFTPEDTNKVFRIIFFDKPNARPSSQIATWRELRTDHFSPKNFSPLNTGAENNHILHRREKTAFWSIKNNLKRRRK